MRRWLNNILGRWQARRIRTKTIQNNYRIISDNQARLEKGWSL